MSAANARVTERANEAFPGPSNVIDVPPPQGPTADGGEFLTEISRQIHHGVATVWILETLAEESPISVYEILGRLQSRAGPEHPIWPSPVYRALGRLRSWGLVETTRQSGRKGSVRSYYSLTSAGRGLVPLVRATAERSWRGDGAVSASGPRPHLVGKPREPNGAPVR